MADIVDIANDLSEMVVELTILAISHAKPEAEATGKCLFCEEPLLPPRRWCDADCCAGWGRLQRRGHHEY